MINDIYEGKEKRYFSANSYLVALILTVKLQHIIMSNSLTKLTYSVEISSPKNSNKCSVAALLQTKITEELLNICIPY